MKPLITNLILSLLLGVFLHSSVRADICVADDLNVSHIRGRLVALWRGGEAPIAGATVELRKFRNNEWYPKFKVVTDEAGIFRIEDAPSGEYEILVTERHFRSFGTRVKLKAATGQEEFHLHCGLAASGAEWLRLSVQSINRSRLCLQEDA